jgi:hypothetical protein
MEFEVQFRNPGQKEFYYATPRNQVFSGAFNNGKTFAGCLKAITLLLTFPRYRMIIARQRYTDLKKTTMQTFFKLLPPGLVESHNEQEGITKLKNGSTVYWLHLDASDEHSLRGIEPNSILVDQAEEIDEKVYDVLDSRLGRWDGYSIPDSLLNSLPNWPTTPYGLKLAPSYHMLLCNPDTEFHFIYRKYHPDSLERNSNYFYTEGAWDSSLGSYESYTEALKRDPEWVSKYVKGQWGRSKAQIHTLDKMSILEPTEELLARIKSRGNLFRSLDHGEAAPTCVLWFAALDGVYICYREYYSPGKVISYHRQAIADLSGTEEYSGNYADPQIFKKTSQKDGGFWRTYDEYITKDIDAPPLTLLAADNNEYATRNRINELLLVSSKYRHPLANLPVVLGESKYREAAPGLYFIKESPAYPHGCKQAIIQLQAQRRKELGTIEGKTIYSDDRDPSVPDHAYDPTRYFVAMHGSQPNNSRKRPARNSFAYYNALLRYKQQQQLVAGSAGG